MKQFPFILGIVLLSGTVLLNTSCRSSHKQQTQQSTEGTAEEAENATPASHLLTDSLLPKSVDLNQDISHLSYQELRILRSYPYAIHGYWFLEGDLNSFFCRKTDWYYDLCDKIAIEAYEHDLPYADTYDKIKLTKEEKAFVEKIDRRMKELERERLITVDDCRLLNPALCINLFQMEQPDSAFNRMIYHHNIALATTPYEQLFNLYENNDYQQMPSFITTDLFLQAFHMYFSYVLKSLERNHFTPALEQTLLALHKESMAMTRQEAVKAEAGYAATFFAIGYHLLTGDRLPVPANFKTAYQDELKHIATLEDAPSAYLDCMDVYFPYSLFKPRGHYTRDENSRRYFQTMMWLQTASFCRTKTEALWRTLVMASAFNRIPEADHRKLQNLDRALTFLMGAPDNASILEIADYLDQNGLTEKVLTKDPDVARQVDGMLIPLFKTRNRIRPKIQISCADKINFLPARYMADNEILGEMADPTPDATRAYPKGLDVFAAFGAESASALLDTCFHEKRNWKDYQSTAEKMKQKFQGKAAGNGTMYDRWLECLVTLQHADKSGPEFMHTPAWQTKSLHTALASWTTLKHDAVLYGEQPMLAECGDGGNLAIPIYVGYVEPHLAFWKKLRALLSANREILEKTGMNDEDLTAKTGQLEQMVDFCLLATEKELRGEVLTQEEYTTIQKMGSSMEWFTLSVIEPGKSYISWDEVKGSERSIALVADVFTRNIPNCSKNGILHEATGLANALYVLVNIGGQTYLTRGATYSYYEFVRPLNERLTDEEWQQELKDGKAPEIPVWIRPYLLKLAPQVNEEIFYSSGC